LKDPVEKLPLVALQTAISGRESISSEDPIFFGIAGTPWNYHLRECARAELLPQFSSVWCAIVANNNKSSRSCSGAVFLLVEKHSLGRCRVHGAGSGDGGGAVQVLPGTPGSCAGSCLLLFFAYKVFLSYDTTTDGSSARQLGRGNGAGSCLLICCVRGGFLAGWFVLW
jgi:hypothetical protein